MVARQLILLEQYRNPFDEPSWMANLLVRSYDKLISKSMPLYVRLKLRPATEVIGGEPHAARIEL
jgi:hypothetical protein